MAATEESSTQRRGRILLSQFLGKEVTQQVVLLSKEVNQLREQLTQAETKLNSRWSTRRVAEAALLECLEDPRVSAVDVERCLQSFPAGASHSATFARSCYESLFDATVTHATLSLVLDKLVLLRRHGIHCSSEFWRQHRKVEHMQLVCSTLGQEGLGRLLAGLHRCLAGQPPPVPDLLDRLDCADLLLTARVLAEEGVVVLSSVQRMLLSIVHYARHGPAARLQAELEAVPRANRAAVVNATHNGFPMLFQPLIEPRGDWLARLRALVEGGVPADGIYRPWNCSALHMLSYRKTGGQTSRLAEASMVEAAQLLLQHGATSVINVADSGSNRGGIHDRTALMQAASDGRFQLVELLLSAGGGASHVDSAGQHVLEILFYLKHSSLAVHREASKGFSCMDLYGLVNRFKLASLMSDELREDCKGCGSCRYLLASVEEEEEEGTVQQERSTSPASVQAGASSIVAQ